ncbi:fatty acid desaturase [Chamaesiphon sp. VAR_48_metabat_403]|uniref:fatty acid desaturase n=1 Tax=Chamaesiphon sp. VAR_48_metabat_403 TaxID=2964700 RepID=UPI00286E5883|nr:fatty acid desaturase [Chamaesiphon sp. VAR_48_metabat_403]
MKGYLDNKQRIVLFFGIGVIFHGLHLIFHVSVANLFVFWILPIVLSSMQLFFFGTYLPHRSGSFENPHHAISSNYPLVLSFLTCYHFGYHWEHHEYPGVPWYGLPSMRRWRSLSPGESPLVNCHQLTGG